MSFFKRYDILPQKVGKIIVPGIYSGNYGHFFCSYIPWLCKYRNEYPNDIIIGSADHVFKVYAEKYCNFFYGFNHPWNTDSPPSAPFAEIMNFKKEVEHSFSNLDIYINTLISGEEAHNLYLGAINTDIELLRDVPYNTKSNIIALWPRYKSVSTWRNGKYKHWEYTAKFLIDSGFEVYCIGVPEASIKIDGIHDATNQDRCLRGKITKYILENARCAIIDQSGVFNETLFLGCPTLIFNSDPHHLPKIKKRNIFGTKLDFYNPIDWKNWTENPIGADLSYIDSWLDKLHAFIKECEVSIPYEKNVANHADVFQKR